LQQRHLQSKGTPPPIFFYNNILPIYLQKYKKVHLHIA